MTRQRYFLSFSFFLPGTDFDVFSAGLELYWQLKRHEPESKEARHMQCQKLKTYIESGRVVFLPPKMIRANPTQPRQVFDQDSLDRKSTRLNSSHLA